VRVEAPVDERTVLHRLRSAVLLVVAVVALGSLAAGLLGGMVYLGAHVINRALG
jgi:ABC-type proline/glycine betaine transport system permease subunit